jgi:hypothetical protein
MNRSMRRAALVFLGALALASACPAAGRVVRGTVTGREELWDRRSNPMMGRPDWLKEIILEIQPKDDSGRLKISLKGAALQKHRRIGVGWAGKFGIEGEAEPYALMSFEPEFIPVAETPKPTPVKPAALKFPEGLRAQELEASPELREKVRKLIAKRYGMAGAKVIFLTSHSGPMPPKGGYRFWGVKGRIKGKWHVWQQGSLAEGSELIDPHRYQK